MKLNDIIKGVDPELRQDFEQYLITGAASEQLNDCLGTNTRIAHLAEAFDDVKQQIVRKPK